MKKISDPFSDEEKKQLSYLGSMLRREPTEEEKETQRVLNWFVEHGMMIKGKIVKPSVPVVFRVRLRITTKSSEILASLTRLTSSQALHPSASRTLEGTPAFR